jgi:Flp pilus assembly protein TadD
MDKVMTKYSISLALLSLITINQFCLAQYKEGAFPGKGSIEAWHRARKILDEGSALKDSGKTDEALSKFKTAIATYPYDGVFWCCLGNCYMDKKEYKLAEDAYRRATVLHPDDWKHWCNLGGALFKNEKYTEYRAAIIKALSLNPPSKEASELKGSIDHIDKYLREQKSTGSKTK